MFIRLTRKEGGPIWFNANYIVTVEPVRNGGSLVVPLGDGLDYEVRERAEDVIPLVEGAQDGGGTLADYLDAEPMPEPQTAPPEAPKAPAAAEGEAAKPAEPPAFESPDMVTGVSELEAASAVAAVRAIKEEILRPVKTKRTTRATRTTRKTKAKAAAEPAPEPAPADAQPSADAAADAPPAADDVFASSPVTPEAPAEAAPGEAAPATDDVFAAPPAKKRAVRRRTSLKTPLDLSDEEVRRLRAMAPRSVKKIVNSLNAQFSVADALLTVRSLAEHGIIAIDEMDHVTWLPEAAAPEGE